MKLTKVVLAVFLGIILMSATVMYRDIITDSTLTGYGYPGSPLGVAELPTITPSQITSDQDDYTPTGWGTAGCVRLSGDNGIRAITSFAAPGAGDIKTKKLCNVGSYAVYIPMDHPDGTAANRITGQRGDYYVFPGRTITITYDGTSSRWRILSGEDVDGPVRSGAYYFKQAGSIASGDNDQLGFAAGGTGSIGLVGATTVSPAYYQMNSGSSATNGYNINFLKGVTGVGYTGSSTITAECQVFWTALSDGTDTYQSQLSITASPTGVTNTPNNTVGIRYSHGINSGKFEGFAIDNAAGTSSVDLGVTVAINTIYVLRVELDKSRTEARFYINGTYAGRLTTNLPGNAQAVGSRCLHLKSVGTTGRVMNVSYLMTKSIYP